MSQLDSENIDKFNVFIVLMQFLYNFRELSLKVLTQSKQKNESYAVDF